MESKKENNRFFPRGPSHWRKKKKPPQLRFVEANLGLNKKPAWTIYSGGPPVAWNIGSRGDTRLGRDSKAIVTWTGLLHSPLTQDKVLPGFGGRC